VPSDAVQDAWTDYRQAIDHLYQLSDREARDRGDAEIRADRLDGVVSRSEHLQAVLAAEMTTEDLAQRELAGLKLLAAAAYDFSIAADAADEQAAASAADRAAASEVLTDPGLRQILDAPQGAGILAVVTVDRGARPSDPAEAASDLRGEISDFLDEIPDRTARAGIEAVTGMAGLAGSVLHGAALLPAPDILARVPDHVSGVLRRAARLVAAAVGKLQAAMGGEQGADAREAVYEWLGEIHGVRQLVTGLVSRLYETARIQAEVEEMLKAADGSVDAGLYNKATETLEELLARHGVTTRTVTWVLRALSLVKKPLLGVVPWGPVAVGAGYVGALGYVVYAGGDYLDWYRLGDQAWLDRVHGLRTTVRETVFDNAGLA